MRPVPTENNSAASTSHKACPAEVILTTMLWRKTFSAASNANLCISHTSIPEVRPEMLFLLTLRDFTILSVRTPASAGGRPGSLPGLFFPPRQRKLERIYVSFRFQELLLSVFSRRAHLIISSFNCTIFSDLVFCLLSKWWCGYFHFIRDLYLVLFLFAKLIVPYLPKPSHIFFIVATSTLHRSVRWCPKNFSNATCSLSLFRKSPTVSVMFW